MGIVSCAQLSTLAIVPPPSGADLGVPPPPINDFDPGLYYCRSRVLSAQFAQCGYAPVPATFDLVECVELSHGVTFATDVRSIGLQMK